MHTPLSRRSLLTGAVALGSTAVVSNLTGCSPSSGVGSSNDSSSHSGERTGKEILFYLSAGHDFAPYKRVISKFEQDHKVKVTIQTFQWPDLQQKLTADFLSGTTPDITEEPGGFWATRFGNDGNIMALDDYIKKDKGFLDDFVPAGLDVRQASGKTYAVPMHLTMGGLVFANSEMLAKAKVPMPTTWEEFLEATKRIQASGVEHGCALNNDSSYGTPWLLQNGIKYTADKSTPMQPADAAVEAMVFQRDLVYKHKVSPTPVASSEYSGPRKLLTSKRCGFIITGPWDISAVRTEDKNFPLIIGAPLKHKEQKTTIAGSGLMIPTKSQNADLCWELIKVLTDADVQAQVTKEVGMACSRKSWAKSDVVQNDPNMRVVATARDLAVAPDRAYWPNQNMAKIADAGKVMYENVILSNKDPRSEVAIYNKTVGKLLSR
ncbi:ABC transporter substrate-binding protein [Cutibacterium avidum]|uniref:ABC transporter substrate-binding protein n=1 Tax=Cutibacterium avidum TaxID=33010 RepID=UPI0008F5B70D|nr:sugar ABC transporter substrate-binding protein [Cutibacterium avidum]MCO6631968.1 sugar ABC transporter substrate-binding protein [Cutibacterium avidum]MCO6664276.1 sugar ABC transporter substrate-binding protein [Cutibacterium avidum]MDQ9081915.1 sugar ABC transporter substrate-binding protein [Cutibacterium avidum]MDY0759037.1 sugar ABC transporter substrate-binding protein [Cutibacterium avidum]OIJ76996.1 ABC transporter substrate-binding protein [Cutibacterium avidum]